MGRKFVMVLCAILSLFVASSCNNTDSSLFTTTVGGNAYDVMVVGNADIWKSDAGRCLFDILDEEMPGLPQSESYFNIIFLQEHDFTDIVKPMRNLVFFKIDPSQFTQGKVSFRKDQWARTQAIVQVTAPNQEEMIRVLGEKKRAILDFFVDMECERSILYFKRYANSDGIKLLDDKLGLHVSLPHYIDKSKVGEKFVWMSNGSVDVRMDILAYRTPYHDKNDMTLSRIVERRDSLTKKYVPGPSEGSYMCVENEVIPPVERHILYKKRKCTEVRGLWRVEGGFMGGPFVSRSFVDTLHQEVVTMDAFVYAPQHEKRNKIRQVEAVLHSLEIE